MTTTLIDDSQNSSSPKYLMPKKLIVIMVTKKIVIQTPGLTLSGETQYCNTRDAAVSWLGVVMMYLNQ